MDRNKQDILQAIDACRPGSDDLYQEEMSALAEALQSDPQAQQWYDRTQRLDAVVTEAFRDVPVPEGLADRLLEAVSKTDDDEEKVVEPAGQSSTKQQSTKMGRKWLRWTISLTSCATLLLLMVGTFLFFFQSKPVYDRDDVVKQAMTWTRDLNSRDRSWNPQLTRAPKKNPFDYVSLQRSPSGWQEIETKLDSHAVAYDLLAPNQPTAVLFVIRIRNWEIHDLQSVPPLSPSSRTEGWCIGVWRKGTLLYVLAVKGNEQQYRKMLRNSAAIVASLDDTDSPVSVTGKVYQPAIYSL